MWKGLLSEGCVVRVAASPRARVVYPRIDPAVIALVYCGDYALLGRQSRWAPGRYSCLAGGCRQQYIQYAPSCTLVLLSRSSLICDVSIKQPWSDRGRSKQSASYVVLDEDGSPGKTHPK